MDWMVKAGEKIVYRLGHPGRKDIMAFFILLIGDRREFVVEF